jgi:hypothetical protein
MTDLYSQLPRIGPHDARLGHALITLVEPAPGHEQAYNRWYEDDHFFAGALFMPWMFAGRRWVAVRELRNLRYPADGGLIEPLGDGCYLGTYWITAGRLEEHKAWTFAANERLAAESRIYHERRHVFTSFQDYAGSAYADASVPRDMFALIDPFPGLVLEVVEPNPGVPRPTLEQWLLGDYLPARLADGHPARLAMVFRTNPPDPGMPAEVRDATRTTSSAGTLTILWFLAEDPRRCWRGPLTDEAVHLAASGLGRVLLVAPFIPSRMGTDDYVDELR